MYYDDYEDREKEAEELKYSFECNGYPEDEASILAHLWEQD